jgi:cell wall-associated NlpC family hydrolase
LLFVKYAVILENMFYFKRTLGLLVGTGLVCTLGTPAYGIESPQVSQVEVREFKTDSYEAVGQTLENTSSASSVVLRDNIQISTNEQVMEAAYAAEPVAIPGNAGLLGAAMAQLGTYQDCTSLVENSLRAIGYSVPDLGPMGFAGYGARVDPSQVQPGDIMMRGGHVSIYAGNGSAVHGGWRGSVVLTAQDANPYNYSIIVRP